MTPFPKVHDWYVARTVLLAVLAAWGVLVGLDCSMALIDEIGDIGKGDYDFTTALVNIAYSIPQRAYTLFPTSAVIGSLLGLGGLAASSELTALRALGLSRRRIAVSAMLGVALLTGLMVASGESVSPWGQRRADGIKASARSADMIVAQYSGLWAREGDVFLNAQTGQRRGDGTRQWLELQGLRLFEFEPDGRLKSVAHASRAEHAAGGWHLFDVRRVSFGERAVSESHTPEERWESRLDEAALEASVSKPSTLTTRELASSIEYRERNGLEANEYLEFYWGRWFYALNVLALCLAAIPFAFGQLRSGGLGKRLFIGILFALGFWLLQTQFVRLAAVFTLDYRIAYLLPIVLMAGISVGLFRHRSG